MSHVKPRETSPYELQSSYQQLVRSLDLLIEEEKRLQLLTTSLESCSRTQAHADVVVNHVRSAELIVTIWGVQAQSEHIGR